VENHSSISCLAFVISLWIAPSIGGQDHQRRMLVRLLQNSAQA
jgi:hypothetical protein